VDKMIISARSVNWRRTGSYINNHVVKFRWPVVQASDLPKFAKKTPSNSRRLPCMYLWFTRQCRGIPVAKKLPKNLSTHIA